MTEQTAPHSPDEHEPTGASPAPAVEPVVEKELPEDIASLSYEAARDQLVEVVRRLESGQGGLEESISLWERGEETGRAACRVRGRREGGRGGAEGRGHRDEVT